MPEESEVMFTTGSPADATELPTWQSPWVFLRAWLDSPRAVGAVWPASQRLARAMARLAPLDGDGVVVELGGGLGAVTEALLERGLAPQRLYVVERDARLAAHLRRRFRQVHVLHCDACELPARLGAQRRVDTIVSSLPLRSLPEASVEAIIAACRAVLAPQGHMVQYTYALFGDSPLVALGARPAQRTVVLGNLPPARVDLWHNVAHAGA